MTWNEPGERGQPAGAGIEEASVQIAKRSALHTLEVMPKRWIVERSFAWLEKG